MSNYEALVARYREYRALGHRLHESLLQLLPKSCLPKVARRLGIELRGNTFVLDSEAELDLMFDYALHDYREPGMGKSLSAVEKLLATSAPPEGSLERLFLEAKIRAPFCLIQVQALEPGIGVEVLACRLRTGS